MADKWIAVTPLRAGTGIKQHADERQIELRAGSCDRIAKIFEQIFVTIHSVWREMPPARVKRHIERRIILLHHRQDEVDRVVEPAEIDAKIWQLVVKPERQHAMGAVADRLGVQERIGSGRFGHHSAASAQYLPRSRPTAPVMSCGCCGSGVK